MRVCTMHIPYAHASVGSSSCVHRSSGVDNNYGQLFIILIIIILYVFFFITPGDVTILIGFIVTMTRVGLFIRNYNYYYDILLSDHPFYREPHSDVRTYAYDTLTD